MKSYAENPHRLVMPSGAVLPRAPVPGEMYHLDVDMPPTDPLLPWFSKGSYSFSGQKWTKMNDTGAQRVATVIGANSFEVEVPTLTKNAPAFGGFLLAQTLVTPSNRKATFSGVATFWADVTVSAHVWAVIFRERTGTPIAVAATFIEAGKPQNMAITFYDIPASHLDQSYTLRVYSDKVCDLFINKCNTFHFDGMGQTAFIVNENT